MAAMQARLEALSVAERTTVSDLALQAITQFLAQHHVASWMRQTAQALSD